MIRDYFRLVRIKNLIIIAITLYIMRWLVIYPILELNGFSFQFSEFNFFLLTISTVFITAGGYVINDYFDQKTDLINCPKRVVVGATIERRHAMTLHNILNFVAIAIGFYIAYEIDLANIGFIFPIISGALWFYSTTYKNQFLIGNIIVALLIALIPLMPVLFEIPMLNKEYHQILIRNGSDFNVLLFFSLGFAFFAFITNLIREIIKDIEDIEGDEEYERKTLPIVLGEFYSKIVVEFIISITIVALILTHIIYLDDNITLWYFLIGLIAPLLFLSYKILKAKETKDYKTASTIIKIIMLVGVGYSSVIYYSMVN